MYPCTCLRTSPRGSTLTDLLIQVGVEHLRLGIHVGLQRMDLVKTIEAHQRAGALLHVAEDARSRGTDLDAGRQQVAGDAVVAERALVGHPGPRVDEARA